MRQKQRYPLISALRRIRSAAAAYRFISFNAAWSRSTTARELGNAIASVQVETSPGHWLKLSHSNWNGWIAQQGAGPGPFTVRVTDVLHNQVTIRNVVLKPGKVQRTRTWMYGSH